MFNKILIANRGEIACRIIKTLRRMGITSVAIYSTADRDALHVKLADEAYWIGPSPTALSYLNIPTILEAALRAGAEAIHPGYGFLSENPEFADACEKAGIVFIGPPTSALQAMASKQIAKQMLEKTPVPLTPGYHGQDQSDKTLLKEAVRLGFPILLKAAAGGGGKGMREVHCIEDFAQALAGARREATAYFADDTILIEKFMQNPRHIEIQIMADHHEQVIHLFERDCSIQRRHQKIIEEAPAIHLSESMRQGLIDAAINVAKIIHYRGAGTVEFLVTDDAYYFMEMNTRLQVEHPVTEMITKLDLVEWQLRIAAHEPLPLLQEDIYARGHAIECRVCAEDADHDFLPSMGTIHFLSEPMLDDNVRLDTGVRLASEMTQYYDPMLAKLIAWGETREQALQRLSQALKQYHIGGIKTNLTFLQAILHNPEFRAGKVSTAFLTKVSLVTLEPNVGEVLHAAMCVDYLQIGAHNTPLLTATLGWQMHLKSSWRKRYRIHQHIYEIEIVPIDSHRFMWRDMAQNLPACELETHILDQQVYYDDGQHHHAVSFETLPQQQWMFYTEYGPVTVESWVENSYSDQKIGDKNLTAPLSATVVAILKDMGDNVQMNEPLVVLEAMKMEHVIRAPHHGKLAEIFCEVGSQVAENTLLLVIDEDTTQ